GVRGSAGLPHGGRSGSGPGVAPACLEVLPQRLGQDPAPRPIQAPGQPIGRREQVAGQGDGDSGETWLPHIQYELIIPALRPGVKRLPGANGLACGTCWTACILKWLQEASG